MDPIDGLISEYQDAGDDARRLIETQPHARLTSRPNPARWSAVECIQHLTLSDRAFVTRLEEAIAKAPQRQGDGPFGLSWKMRIFKWFLEPPVRFRFPTSKPFVPRPEIEPKDALEEFLEAHNRLLGLLSESRGKALDKVEVVSPFAEKVHYSAWSTFVLAVAHERRHLWQAHQAVRL